MSADNDKQPKDPDSEDNEHEKVEDIARIGGERELQQGLKQDDETAGESISDNFKSKDRRDRRRAIFVDIYGDEDGDPDTDDNVPDDLLPEEDEAE